MASVREYIRRDGLLIAASLLLAVLVWNYVNDELTETLTVTARLELDAPEGLTLSGGVPREVSLVLRGTKRSLNAVDPDRMTVHYKLPTGVTGPVEVVFQQSDFALPPGVEVYEYPERFTVELGRIATRRVPVRVNTAGEAQAGYTVSGVIAEPADVEISGSRERIDQIAQVETRTVDLSGRSRFFTTDSRLDVPAGVRCHPESVRVSVDIAAAPVVREVPGVEVRILTPSGFDGRVRVEPSSVAIKVRGIPAVVTGLTARDILAAVDLSGMAGTIRPETRLVTVRLVLPPGVSLAPEAEAPKVRVQIGER